MNVAKPVIIRKGQRSQETGSEKYAMLVSVIQELMEKQFTGHLKINFSQGGIGRIEKFEEILRGTVGD
jgi:hypothetical protein